MESHITYKMKSDQTIGRLTVLMSGACYFLTFLFRSKQIYGVELISIVDYARAIYSEYEI